MTSADGTDRSLVLLHYKNRPAPAPGSAVTGFEVSGIDAVVQRVADAGGTVTEPPRLMTNIGSRSPSSKIWKDTYWRSLNAFDLRAGPAVTIRPERRVQQERRQASKHVRAVDQRRSQDRPGSPLEGQECYTHHERQATDRRDPRMGEEQWLQRLEPRANPSRHSRGIQQGELILGVRGKTSVTRQPGS